jgi:hypothetical protein
MGLVRSLSAVMERLLVGAVLAAATLPTPARQDRQTVTGAYERAVEALRPVTRDAQLQLETRGAQGRKNALLDNMHLSEEPPFVQPPLSGAWHP